ncbi:hypothetical protein MTO96_017513 [Rhipicephalus appendiculatus]
MDTIITTVLLAFVSATSAIVIGRDVSSGRTVAAVPLAVVKPAPASIAIVQETAAGAGAVGKAADGVAVGPRGAGLKSGAGYQSTVSSRAAAKSSAGYGYGVGIAGAGSKSGLGYSYGSVGYGRPGVKSRYGYGTGVSFGGAGSKSGTGYGDGTFGYGGAGFKSGCWLWTYCRLWRSWFQVGCWLRSSRIEVRGRLRTQCWLQVLVVAMDLAMAMQVLA